MEYRVVIGDIRFRALVGCFFYPSTVNTFKPYGVIKELLYDNSPIYRETHALEFMAYYMSKKTALPRRFLILSRYDKYKLMLVAL